MLKSVSVVEEGQISAEIRETDLGIPDGVEAAYREWVVTIRRGDDRRLLRVSATEFPDPETGQTHKLHVDYMVLMPDGTTRPPRARWMQSLNHPAEAKSNEELDKVVKNVAIWYGSALVL